MVKTAEDYQKLILEDILEWYKGVEAPSLVPGHEKLSLLMREARILVDTQRSVAAKEHNAKLHPKKPEGGNGPELTGSGVPK